MEFKKKWLAVLSVKAAQQANACDAPDFAFFEVGFGILRLLVIELCVGALIGSVSWFAGNTWVKDQGGRTGPATSLKVVSRFAGNLSDFWSLSRRSIVDEAGAYRPGLWSAQGCVLGVWSED